MIHRDNWIIVVFYICAAIGAVQVTLFAYEVIHTALRSILLGVTQ